MKNRLKITKILRCGVLAVSVAFCGVSSSAENTTVSTQRIDALDDLSFVEMLNSPELGSQAEKISKFQMKEGQSVLLKNNKYKNKEVNIEMTRNKEVLLVTIPADLLFGPNEIVLSEGAGAYLEPIKRYLKQPDMYRVLLAMHTDNTGSPQYRDQLTEERVDAVFDYFESGGNVDTRYLFSYALSDDLPLVENDSFDKRKKNRRLEIYLVPGEKMIEQAKKGRIAF